MHPIKVGSRSFRSASILRIHRFRRRSCSIFCASAAASATTPPEALSPELLDQLKEAVLRSPSSRGLDPWEFIFVTDKALLAQPAAAKPHGAHFLRDAALGVVVLGDEAKADTWIEDCAIAAIILHLAAPKPGLVGSCWVQIRCVSTSPESRPRSACARS